MKRFVLVALAACTLGACGHYDYGPVYSASYYEGDRYITPPCNPGGGSCYYGGQRVGGRYYQPYVRPRSYVVEPPQYSTYGRQNQSSRSNGYMVTPPQNPRGGYYNDTNRRAGGYRVTPPCNPGGRCYGETSRGSLNDRRDYRDVERRITRNDGSEQHVIQRRQYRNDPPSRARPERRERPRRERNRRD